MQKKAQVFVLVPGTYNYDYLVKRLENVIFGKELSISGGRAFPAKFLSRLITRLGGEFRRTFLVGSISWTVSMLQLRLMFSAKIERAIFVKGTLPIWSPEQNSVVLMEDMVFKYFNPGALVMKEFEGNISSSKACLSPHKH